MRYFILLCLGIVYSFSMDKILIDVKQVTIPKLKGELSKYSYSVKNKKITPFYISKYEITNKDYNKYLKAQNKKFKNYDEYELNEPVVNIDFYTAQKVCKFYKGRLPTELEWIVAASFKVAKSKCYEYLVKNRFYPYPTAKYPLNNNDPQIKCMLKDDDEIEAEFIGSELSEVEYSYENINGVYGMLGNVWEWVNSDRIYFGKKYKVIKGGSYANFKEKIFFDSRISNFLVATSKLKNVGFRCVWDKKRKGEK